MRQNKILVQFIIPESAIAAVCNKQVLKGLVLVIVKTF